MQQVYEATRKHPWRDRPWNRSGLNTMYNNLKLEKPDATDCQGINSYLNHSWGHMLIGIAFTFAAVWLLHYVISQVLKITLLTQEGWVVLIVTAVAACVLSHYFDPNVNRAKATKRMNCTGVAANVETEVPPQPAPVPKPAQVPKPPARLLNPCEKYKKFCENNPQRCNPREKNEICRRANAIARGDNSNSIDVDDFEDKYHEHFDAWNEAPRPPRHNPTHTHALD